MQDASLEKRFKDAVARAEMDQQRTRVRFFLAELRDTVKELQEAGYTASMEVRRGVEGVVPMDGSIVATVVTTIGDQVINWTVQGSDWRTTLEGKIGQENIASYAVTRISSSRDDWTYPDLIGATTFRESLANVMLNTLAVGQTLSAYDVGTQGLQKTPLEKAKLRKPGLPS